MNAFLKLELKRAVRLGGLMVIATLMSLSSGILAAETVANRYLIKFKPGTAAQVSRALSKAKATVKLKLDNHDAIAVTMPESAIIGLSNNPNIEYIELDTQKNLYLQETPYAISMLQADLLSDDLTGSQKICVIDTGLDSTHEDIASNNLSGQGDWSGDTNGHGTYMVSAIASFNNNTGVVGVAPNGYINIHVLNIWDRYASSYIKALDNCQAAGANIITISAGSATQSKTEKKAFQQAYDNNVLIFAAVGNEGDTTVNYPSAYPGVIGVGAIDKNKQHAFFSVQNEYVELVAPGWYAKGAWTRNSNKDVMLSDLLVNGSELEVMTTINSMAGEVSAPIADCGQGVASCADAFDKICLISASVSNNLTSEVTNCQNSGGVGAIIHGDQFIVGYGEGRIDAGSASIPVVNARDDDAAYLRANLGSIVTLKNWHSVYKESYGTSMSTPYAAAVSALVWSYHSDCSNQQIRQALQSNAEDLGSNGKDIYFGYGLAQALATKQYLDANPCGTVEPPIESISLALSKTKRRGVSTVKLAWNGASGTLVDIYRNNVLHTSAENDGQYSETPGSGVFQYQVCEQASGLCSASQSISL
jgi:serine protease